MDIGSIGIWPLAMALAIALLLFSGKHWRNGIRDAMSRAERDSAKALAFLEEKSAGADTQASLRQHPGRASK